MGEPNSRTTETLTSLPRLFCAPNLRCAVVSDHLVLLDLSAGDYHVLDEIGTAMWMQLLRFPAERDKVGLAEKYHVPQSVVAADLIDFATEQLVAGRLLRSHVGATNVPVPQMARHRPTIARAVWERSRADRDLRKGFAEAYASRTDPAADTAPPRVGAARLMNLFGTAEILYPTRRAPLDCLPRSLAMTRFLRTAGWQAQHVMGVAMYPFDAHAWVELDGVPLGEGATFLQRFTVIQRA